MAGRACRGCARGGDKGSGTLELFGWRPPQAPPPAATFSVSARDSDSVGASASDSASVSASASDYEYEHEYANVNATANDLANGPTS